MLLPSLPSFSVFLGGTIRLHRLQIPSYDSKTFLKKLHELAELQTVISTKEKNDPGFYEPMSLFVLLM